MRLLCSIAVLSCFLLALGCSSDDGPGQADQGTRADATRTDGPVTDAPVADAPPTDAPVADAPVVDAPVNDSNVLPWPDGPIKDVAGTACTPEAAGMCDDDKNFYCNGGQCAACPLNKRDCNRKADDECECAGVCNGTKCVGGA